MVMALQQIQGRQTARYKLPSWAAHDDMVYPPHLNMEQCSSEQTARYKAAVARRLLGDCRQCAPSPLQSPPSSLQSAPSPLQSASSPSLQSPSSPLQSALSQKGCPTVHPTENSPHTTLIDLTGGLGVDFSFMSRAFSRAIYVERNADLCALATANFRTLGLQTETVCSDGISYFRTFADPIGMVFIDPARRDGHGGRTYDMADCTPDVLSVKDELLEKARVVMLKLSPMLDWRKAVSDLGAERVSEVHIVAVGGECKELLVVMQRQPHRRPLRVVCVNDNSVWVARPGAQSALTELPSSCKSVPKPLSDRRSDASDNDGDDAFCRKMGCILPQNGTRFAAKWNAFCRKMENEGVGMYLLEPNAAAMKSGLFNLLADDFNILQLAPNSHLFLSEVEVRRFPGRQFSIVDVTTMNKRELRRHLGDMKQANITVRNFPLTVVQLRQRLKINEGGSTYIFATTLANGDHVLLIAQRI